MLLPCRGRNVFKGTPQKGRTPLPPLSTPHLTDPTIAAFFNFLRCSGCSIASVPIASNYLANAGGLRAGVSAASRGATDHRGVCVPNLSLAGRPNSKQFKQFVLIFKLGAGILFTSHNLELQLASKRLRNRGAMVGGL
jgi:hypothetical protein